MPVLLDLNVDIGASGAVSNLKGPYVESVTRLGTGAYQIKMRDNYNRFYSMLSAQSVAVTGANINISSGLTLGQAYIITALGTSTTANFQALGLPEGVEAAVGVGFVASTASAGTGTGTVKAVAASNITAIQLVGNQQLTMAPSDKGAIILIQCFGPTGAGDTTLIPADPANGSMLFLQFMLSNSSVLIGGE